MVQQFLYKASGRFLSGATFETELLVIASSEDEAEDEAVRCIDSFESIIDWSLKPFANRSADEHGASRYQARGVFSVFDPAVLQERA